jgi:hypothetical protein
MELAGVMIRLQDLCQAYLQNLGAIALQLCKVFRNLHLCYNIYAAYCRKFHFIRKPYSHTGLKIVYPDGQKRKMGGIGILRKIFIILLFFLGLMLTACGPQSERAEIGFGDSTRTISIDDQFKNIYSRMDNICGPAISPLFEKYDKKYQYTISCLFINDPNQLAIKRNSLAPLGYQWHVEEPAEPKPEDESKVYINGHVVWDEVMPYYSKYGTGVIGKPLTGVHFYPDQNRYAQYFENMGFYRFIDEPVNQVHLMPYGAWMCKKACIKSDIIAFDTSITSPRPPDDPALQEAESAFNVVAERLGRDFVGLPRSTTYQSQDGMYEKVFNNVVMYSSPEMPSRVLFRPLPQIVGINPEPPVPPLDDPGMFFFPTVQEDLGYNIPVLFMTYISQHGTLEVSGNPITELHPIGNGVSRQCFVNICLEYHSKAPEILKVRPSALGLSYHQTPIVNSPITVPTPTSQAATPTTEIPTPVPQMVTVEQPTPTTPAKPTHVPQALSLQVWERYPMLPPTQMQEIGVALFEGLQPLSDVGFSLTVTLPDGSVRNTVMSPTGQNGQTSAALDPFDVPIGTIIPYQVCITNLLDRPVCISESFMIWDGQ